MVTNIHPCENCQNWLNDKAIAVCHSCYWAHPENYTHIALQSIRRTELVWIEDEVEIFEEIKKRADASNKSLQTHIKAISAHFLGHTPNAE